jgi:hypothetical protein
MRKDDQIVHEVDTVRNRRRRYSLYYFEHVGTRSYLRITRFGLFLILLSTIGAMIALFSLLLINRSTPMPSMDFRTKSPSASVNVSTEPIIKQVPPPRPQKAIQIPLSKQTPPTAATPPTNNNS